MHRGRKRETIFSASVVLAAAAVIANALTADATTVNVNLLTPTLDRWNYPFAGNPGGNPYAAVFAPLTAAGFDPSFDNRDGQMLVGFDTHALVTPGLGQWRYTVLSAVVKVTVESDHTFQYDPTPDSYRCWLSPNDAEFQADSDAGHAVELFGTWFRFGQTALTHGENAAYSPQGSIGKNIRTAFSACFRNGQLVDASNNVDLRFDPAPFAVATSATLTQGQFVPADTQLQFTLNVNDAGVNRYLRRALNEGMIDLSIASIFPSEQQTSGTYPRFYTKENLAVQLGLVSAAQLSIVVDVSPNPWRAGDVNGDGLVNVNDLLAVISAWGPCPCCAADVTYDGLVNVNDLLLVISTWGS
jgi:hypothetical protein